MNLFFVEIPFIDFDHYTELCIYLRDEKFFGEKLQYLKQLRKDKMF